MFVSMYLALLVEVLLVVREAERLPPLVEGHAEGVLEPRIAEVEVLLALHGHGQRHHARVPAPRQCLQPQQAQYTYESIISTIENSQAEGHSIWYQSDGA